VTISAIVTNVGDLSGSYEVYLKVNNIVEATDTITLDGGASERVTFSTSKDVAGSYNVELGREISELTILPSPLFTKEPLLIWYVIGGILIGLVIGFFIVARRIHPSLS
jgi:hypothetical protein